MHLYSTGLPNEFEESEISSENDCFVDGENILNEYRRNKFTFFARQEDKKYNCGEVCCPWSKRKIEERYIIKETIYYFLELPKY